MVQSVAGDVLQGSAWAQYISVMLHHCSGLLVSGYCCLLFIVGCCLELINNIALGFASLETWILDKSLLFARHQSEAICQIY